MVNRELKQVPVNFGSTNARLCQGPRCAVLIHAMNLFNSVLRTELSFSGTAWMNSDIAQEVIKHT